MVSRRQVLIATSLGVLSASGCSSLRSESGVAIDSVSIHNEDDEAHELTVEITSDADDVTFRETLTVEPGAGESIANPVSGKSDFVIEATVGGKTVRERATDYVSDGEECAIPAIRIADEQVFLEIRTFDQC